MTIHRFSVRASWARRLFALPALLALALAILSACALPKGAQEHISGTIQGRRIVDAKTGKTQIAGVAAKITCGDGSAQASATGAYTLAATVASVYACTLSAPDFRAVTVNVPGSAQASMVVNFAADWLGDCSITARLGAVTCPGLQPPPGTLVGAVLNPTTDAVAKGVNVTCWNTDSALQADGQLMKPVTAKTDQLGHFSLSLPADRYGCVANDDARLYSVTIAPARTTTVDFDVCDPNCPSFDYHNGTVMHALTVYLIFWLPKGQGFEPGGSDKRYESLMARYFSDVGGTPYYDILTQYWDNQGPISDSVAVGGTYVDTTAYPHAGTQADPLYDTDIQNEVSRAVTAKQWPDHADDAMFVVFTGYDVQSCNHGRGEANCSFETGNDFYCGYHSNYQGDGGTRIYAYISDAAACAQLPYGGEYAAPNGDAIADAEMSIVSHELFETVSDPLGDAWYDGVPQTGEMGDKCRTEYGTIQSNGANVTLNHGHSYIVQAEWSLAAGGCAFSYTPQA